MGKTLDEKFLEQLRAFLTEPDIVKHKFRQNRGSGKIYLDEVVFLGKANNEKQREKNNIKAKLIFKTAERVLREVNDVE
jgi:hypothetical protein